MTDHPSTREAPETVVCLRRFDPVLKQMVFEPLSEQPSALPGVREPAEPDVDEFAQRLAVYIYDIDGLSSLDREERRVCQDAAAWAVRMARDYESRLSTAHATAERTHALVMRLDGLLETAYQHDTLPVRVSLLRELRAALGGHRG